MDPEKGYNRMTGGDRKGARASDLSKEKISQARLHTCLTNPEFNLWNKNHMLEHYRKHPERRREIAEQMRNYLLSPEGRKFVLSSSKPKPVRCVETGKIYPSQRAAERETGFCSIHKVCAGSRRVSGGCHWEYV